MRYTQEKWKDEGPSIFFCWTLQKKYFYLAYTFYTEIGIFFVMRLTNTAILDS